MKKFFVILASMIICWVLVFSNLFIFAPRFESEKIAGFKYPEGSELIFKRRNGPYKIYKWNIPKKDFRLISTPAGVSESPFNEFKWSRRQYIEFGEGAEQLLDAKDVASDSESVSYRTAHNAVELIRSKSESTITIISIYNN